MTGVQTCALPIYQVVSLQNAGGASRYVYELTAHLSRMPEVMVGTVLGFNASSYPFHSLEATGAKVVSWGTAMKAGLKRYMVNELLTTPYVARRRWDIYHPTLYRSMPFVRARRMVATHYDCVHERFPELVTGRARVIRAKRRLYNDADVIICISESSRQDLLDFYSIDASKTRVIHLGMQPLPTCATAGRDLETQTRRPYALFVGARRGYKNFDALLAAYHDTALFKALDLLVIGGAPLTAAEIELVKKLGLAGCVIHVQLASDELLAEAYRKARFLVYPSLYEGFGLPPIEAMAAGCPVVACRTSAMPEVCLDAPFYFEPKDPSSLGRAIVNANEDEDARRCAIQRGRDVAVTYSWAECANRTLAVYRDCCGEATG